MDRKDLYSLIRKLIPKNLWNLIWVALIAAVLITAMVNYVQSLFWEAYMFRDLLVIGTIDAIVVALIVAPIVIKMGIIEKERIEAELRTMALTDDLTKLNNRRGFFLFAEQLMKMADRSGQGMYLMYADLDDFKKINDEHGHSEGDRALQAFARLLQANFRESDIIARLGGDEFVIFPIRKNEDSMDSIKKRFLSALSVFNDSNETQWKLKATFGFAYYDPAFTTSIDDLLRQADTALYGEKKR